MSKYHKYRNELIEELGGKCEKCGDTEDLQFHHINKDHSHKSGIGGWNHIFKVKNDLKNEIEVVLLCRECHQKEHKENKDLKDKIK